MCGLQFVTAPYLSHWYWHALAYGCLLHFRNLNRALHVQQDSHRCSLRVFLVPFMTSSSLCFGRPYRQLCLLQRRFGSATDFSRGECPVASNVWILLRFQRVLFYFYTLQLAQHNIREIHLTHPSGPRSIGPLASPPCAVVHTATRLINVAIHTHKIFGTRVRKTFNKDTNALHFFTFQHCIVHIAHPGCLPSAWCGCNRQMHA